MRNWKKLKGLRGEPELTGRPLEKPFRFSRRGQTRWPELNRRLEHRINRRVARAHSPTAAARCPLHASASAKSKTGAGGAIRRSKSPGRRAKCCCRGANQFEAFGHIVDYEFPDFPDVLAIVKRLVAAGKLLLAYASSHLVAHAPQLISSRCLLPQEGRERALGGGGGVPPDGPGDPEVAPARHRLYHRHVHAPRASSRRRRRCRCRRVCRPRRGCGRSRCSSVRLLYFLFVV